MSDEIVQPVVLDATVLSNFASSGTVAQLVDVLDRPVSAPAVRDELVQGRERGYLFLEHALAHLDSNIELLENCSRTVSGGIEIRDRLDSGEAESLICAIDRGGTLATDDRAARRLASDHDTPVTGSVGLLVLGVRRGVIDTATANDWLADWREERGYYAPVEQVEEVLD